MDIGLSKDALQEVAEKLQLVLANTYALYLKTQNYHWNVKGHEFYSLHLLFEKHYEELADAIDETAERIRALGFLAEGSFSAFSKRSSIPEAQQGIGALQMIEELVKGHETLCKIARPMVARFQELHDDASSDFLIKRLAEHEMAAWTLRSHLQK